LQDAGAWNEALQGCQILKHSKYIFLVLQQKGGESRQDARIGATLASIITQNLQKSNRKAVYVFDPETSDGKQLQRHSRFQRWFDSYSFEAGMIKDELSIIEETEKGTISSFIAVMYASEHEHRHLITSDIQQFHNNIMMGSADNDEDAEIF